MGNPSAGAPLPSGGRAMPRQRWTMILLCFAATTINYVDRATIAVAAPFMARALHISPPVLGMLLGGFFWSYALMQLPAGLLVDRFGPRRVYAAAVLWWSTFTAATAAVTGPGMIFALRVALGLGEAGSYPSNAKVAALWFPTRERGLAAGIFDSGSRAGSALAIPIVAALVAWLGWRAAFVATGLLGVAWTAAWLALYRDPAAHRGVAPDALARLRAAQPVVPARTAGSWRSLFRHRTVWGMMLGFFCLNFVFYFYTTWFPTYLVQSRGFSLKALGMLGMLPGLAAIPAAWLGGWASDRLFRAGWSLTWARKSCLVGGLLLSSVIALTPFVAGTAACLALFSAAYAGIAFAGANIWSLPADVAPGPQHVAALSGIQNGAANLAGLVTAGFTGIMVGLSGGSFVVPLLAAGGFCLLGAASYLFIVGPVAPLPEAGDVRAHPLVRPTV